MLDTATWRASLDWGARLGYSPDEMAAVNRRSVDFIRDLAVEFADVPTVLNGAIGPRGDGYVAGDAMSVAEATAYHALQTRAFAEAGADMVSAVTMTNVPEAVGVVAAAVSAGLPVAVSFTVETDGVLPSGEPLGAAIEAVDDQTDGAPAYYMVNCAHPTHFDHVLDGGGWVSRIRGIRANASDASHEELDEAVELDRGDVDDLARRYARLQDVLPPLAVVGGCCGTDHEHISAIADAVLTAPAR